jgi:Fe-S-cluster containining protein
LRWHNEGRDDILGRLVIVGEGVDAWFNPTTGAELNKCPFLRKTNLSEKYMCSINDTKPDACRQYKPGECVGCK